MQKPSLNNLIHNQLQLGETLVDEFTSDSILMELFAKNSSSTANEAWPKTNLVNQLQSISNQFSGWNYAETINTEQSDSIAQLAIKLGMRSVSGQSGIMWSENSHNNYLKMGLLVPSCLYFSTTTEPEYQDRLSNVFRIVSESVDKGKITLPVQFASTRRILGKLLDGNPNPEFGNIQDILKYRINPKVGLTESEFAHQQALQNGFTPSKSYDFIQRYSVTRMHRRESGKFQYFDLVTPQNYDNYVGNYSFSNALASYVDNSLDFDPDDVTLIPFRYLTSLPKVPRTGVEVTSYLLRESLDAVNRKKALEKKLNNFVYIGSYGEEYSPPKPSLCLNEIGKLAQSIANLQLQYTDALHKYSL